MGYFPWIIVLGCGALGYWIAGLPGLFSGLGIGYVGIIAIGKLSIKMTGRLLDRKQREELALTFVRDNADKVHVALPDADTHSQLLELQRLADAIFQQAASDNRALDQNVGSTRGAIQIAAAKLADAEVSMERRELILALEEHIEMEMYP